MSATYQQARLSRDPRFDGKFFVAVKTTHIFCRPICPANLPLEKNVEYYELAESAILSGYRPCLRCRPDSAPDSFAWQGVDTTLNRAIKLLKQYPELSINEITTKLGVSPRYLRQLFQHKLGMSPKQFQLFNKVLFAKRLLHESQISVEQVAMASGFSSSRRLQSQFKKITGLTPSNIRKVKSVSMPNQNINLKLNYRPPYHWEHIKDFLFLRAIKGIETITDNSYSRTFVIEQEPGWFKMTFNPKHTYFDLEIKLNNLSHLRSVIMNIERLFDLKADPVAIHNQLLATGLAKEHLVRGLRLPGVWNCFEAGCRAILGQQISVKSAISLLTKLSENLAEKHQTLAYFPSASAVANSNLEFLKIPNSRKQTLIDFASYMQNNEKNPLNHSIDDLILIKGIGPWTVSYVKLRGQSSPDIWLDSDLIIKKQLAQYKISPQKAEPWRSYLTLQLWNLA
ncbi:helix-turn-helix domain-containing protein [Paraglaciecola aquimarina]|uniref:Helix-turn-helix domain-containing protein n=1 Tax=Paraglaciecola algarum TaxID=3050085 RepID=A0ABS9D4E6_9ALTE|nr:AlkA N-terminal domain-containing protein [Paraglaciecola sp. G1-23]MCF2947524.1 helix-turn-helix domain-containing protein [Paraglaciecola sp. G1-23]